MVDILRPRHTEALPDPRAQAEALAVGMKKFGANSDYTKPAIDFAEVFLSEVLAVQEDPEKEVYQPFPAETGVAQTILARLVGPGDRAFRTDPSELPEGITMQVIHPVFGVPGLYARASLSPSKPGMPAIHAEYDLISKHYLPQRIQK